MDIVMKPETVSPDPNSLRVLIVEDSRADERLLIRELERGGYAPTTRRVETPREMTEALAEEEWDVVISDYRMPRFSALEALRLLQGLDADIPFIIVSGTIGEETAVTALKAGAHDFMTKDKLARLIPAIEREIREAENRRQRRRIELELRQAQKMEALGRLAGGIAHDFNNLLTVIQGTAQFAVDRLPEGEEEIAEELKESLSAINRATALTNRLLSFSRHQMAEPQTLQLNELLEDVKGLLDRIIGEKIEILVERDPDLPTILANPGQIEQVLINLAVNARDAMLQGGTLRFRTERTEQSGESPRTDPGLSPGALAVITVEDEGIGMPPAVRERIFEPFFTTKGEDRGTGLGLSMAYGIMKHHRGKITVESEEGRGTRFRLIFPEGRRDEEAEAPETRGRRLRGGAAVILVAEDDPAVRGVIERALSRRGHEVIGAGSGEEALSKLRARPAKSIDLVLSDVVMPGMSGGLLAQELRRIDPHIRIVLMSGYSEEDQESEIPPGTEFLQKPFGSEEVIRVVEATMMPETEGGDPPRTS